VKKDKLEQIGKKLEEKMNQSGRLPLSESIKIAETEGVEDAASAMEALGYRIVWHGISTEEAEVIRAKNQSN
jgi:hypothetical protein